MYKDLQLSIYQKKFGNYTPLSRQVFPSFLSSHQRSGTNRQIALRIIAHLIIAMMMN
jgi:hypothetical protein